MRRKITKRLLITVIGLIVLVAVSLSVSHLPFVKSKFFSTLQLVLEKKQGVHLSAESFDYNLFGRSFFLEGVRLEKSGREDLIPLFQSESIRIKISLSTLYTRTLAIDDLEAINSELNIIIDEQGGNNLPFESSSSETGLVRENLPDFVIRRLMAENIRLHFFDARSDLEVLVPGIGVSGSWMGAGRHAIDMETSLPGSVDFHGKFFSLGKAGLKAEIFKDGINFDNFFVNLEGNEFTLAGSLNGFSSLLFEGTCEGNLNLDSVRAAMGIPDSFISGNIKLRSELRGPLQELSAHVLLESGDLAYREWEEVQLDSEIYWKGRELEIRSLDLKNGREEAHANGRLHPLEWEAGNHLNLEWSDIDAARIGDALNSPITLSSVSSGTLTLSWDGFSRNDITGECEIDLVSNGSKKADLTRTELTGRIRAQSDENGFRAVLQDILISGALLQGELQLQGEDISGSYRLKAPDIAGIISLAESFFDRPDLGIIQALALDGPMEVSGQIGGNPGNPAVTFDIESENLEILGMENIGILGSIVYEDHSLGINSLEVHDRNGKLSVNGSYPTGSPERAMHFEVEGEDLPLEMILSVLGSPVAATGKAVVSAVIGGSIEAPEIVLQGTISHGAVYGQDIDKLEFSAGYRNKKAVLENLSGHRLSGSLEGNGFYDLSSKEFNITLTAKQFPLQGMILPGTSDSVSAGVDIDLEARGNLVNPNLRAKGHMFRAFYGPCDLGDLEFELHTLNEEVAFHVDSPLYSSSIDGTLSLGHPRLLKMELNSNRMSLDVVRDKIFFLEEADFSGFMTSLVSVEMDLDEPGNMIEANARIEQIQISKEEHLIQNKGPILADYHEDVIHIKNLVLAGSGMDLDAGGYINLRDSSLSGLGIKADLDLSLLAAFIPDMEGAGSLRIESEFKGSLNSPDISASLELTGAEFQYGSFPVLLEDIHSSMKIKDNVIGIDSLALRLEESRIVMKGTIPLESLPVSLPEFFGVHGNREAELTVGFRDFDPAVLALIHSREMARLISGRLAGELAIKGHKLQTGRISGTAQFETLELIVSGIPLKQKEPSLVQLEDGLLSFQKFILVEGDNQVALGGTAEIAGNGKINLLLQGKFGLGRLKKLDRKSVFSGNTAFEIHIGESFASPSVQGFLDIQDGRVRRFDPGLFLEQLNGRIKFFPGRIEIGGITGILNGGRLVVNGKAGFKAMELHDVALNLRTVNSAVEFPAGLRSVVSGDFRLTSREQDYLLAGAVSVLDSRYTDDFDIGSSLSQVFKKDPARDLFQDPSPYLKQLSLDISLRTQKNLIIDNNIAKSQATANIKLSGTADRPSLAGRINLVDGGELYFSQNIFTIDKGTVDFVNPTRIEPDLNLSASTKVKEYDITLVLQGVPDKLTASLISDPLLSEPNIVSLLVTGRTMESASASILSVAGSTALSYLTSSLTGRVEQATARALGLESVRIDSGLISTEQNPEARITLGQHLSRDFELVFSQGLKDARNQMWMTNYNPFLNFNIQGIKRDDNEYNLAFSHDLLFGLKRSPVEAAEEKLNRKEPLMGKVELSGNLALPESEIRKKLKWQSGKRFSMASLQDSLDRVRELYRENNYLGFSLNSRTEENEGRLDLFARIDSGPKIILEYEGADLPKRLKKDILDAWTGSSFGQLAREDISQRIRIQMLEEGYYQASVQSREVKGGSGDRTILFSIEKGVRFNDPVLHFQGNRLIESKVISDYLRENRLVNLAFYDPGELKVLIEAFYGRGGFLRPEVDIPVIRYEPDRKEVFLDFSIKEGDRFRVREVNISGVHLFKDEQIFEAGGIHPGDTVSPEVFSRIEEKIEEIYLKKGFNDVHVLSDISVNSEKGTVDLAITVEENQGWIVEEILVSGNVMTNEQVIRREIRLKKGDEINFKSINESRKRLYDLGVFERVNIEVVPAVDGGADASGNNENQTAAMKPFRIVVDVKEIEPYRLRYGLQYDTDSSFGIMSSLVDRNFLGKAFLLGSSLRLNRDERDARAFFRSPHMFANKINSEFYLFYNKTFKPAFDVERRGFTLQQQFKSGESNLVSYNYSYEKIGTFTPGQDGNAGTEDTERAGTFNLAFTHDSRNDILNATRGMFLSNSLRYAPGFLGSDARYLRYFGQFSTYKKLTDFLIYASSVRVGLGKAWGEELPLSERFFAGGGTTIRGFRKDELGPKDPATDLPLGGDAVFILNQELRTSIYRNIGTAAFLDLGNVYPKISNFDPTDIRKTAGFGLRFQTPFILIRLDWGFKLDRRPGESPSQIFFSIGQAF